MAGSEDEFPIELLGRDDPAVQALVAASKVPGMGDQVHEMLRAMVRQRGWDPNDLPAFALPRDLSPSDFPVGTAMSGDVAGEEVGPSEVDLPSHVGVFGMTSVGKTTLVKLILLAFMGIAPRRRAPGHSFMVLDMHGEYASLLPLFRPGDLIWMTADDIGINPLEVPAGRDGRLVMTPDKWVGNLREWLRISWLGEVSCNLFCEILLGEYARRGLMVADGAAANWPSLGDIIEVIRQLDAPRGSDRAKGKEKLLDRLETLRAMLPGLDVSRSRNFRKLVERSVILDLVDTRDTALPALFALLMTVQQEAFRGEGDNGISRMLVIEEAHLILGGQVDKRTSDLKEGKPSSVLRDLRKTGTTALVVSQLISDLAAGVRGNLGTVFCLRQGNRQCVREAAAALNLEPWREGEVAKLPNRRAIARFSRYGEPVYLAVKDARSLLAGGSPPPSREEARARSKATLEAIPFVKRSGPAQPRRVEGFPTAARGPAIPPAGVGRGAGRPSAGRAGTASPTAVPVEAAGPIAKQGGMAGPTVDGGRQVGPAAGTAPAAPAAAEGGLHPREKQVYARIAERPWELIEDRLDATGLDREVEGNARQKLEARGLIALAGKVGAKNRLFELTARGRELAETMGLPIARQEKGGVPHEAIVQYTQRSLGRHSSAFRFQRAGVSATVRGVQPDLLLLLPTGGRIPIQACCHNQPAYEAAALLRLHELALLGPGDADRVDFVLAVAVNKRHREAVERALERGNGGSVPGRVAVLDFDTMVDPKFDWASVLELPL